MLNVELATEKKRLNVELAGHVLRVLAFIANPEVRDAYSVRYIWRGDSQLTTS